MPESRPNEGRPVPAWRRYARFLRTDVRADVHDELEFHIAMIADRFITAGLAPDEARARARAEFGDIERARRLCEAIDSERTRRLGWTDWLASVRADARLALRTLARSPGLAVTIILTLVLGLGASTAIFSVVRGVLLRPLPYADSDRLVRIWEVSPRGDDHNIVSIGNYVSWRERAKSFAAIGAHSSPIGVNLVLDGEPSRIIAADLTPSTMRALGVRAALGRSLVSEDDAGDGHVVVLSDEFWRRQFGGDLSVLGRRLTLNEVPYTVVGVMPAAFEFPSAGVDVWRPVTLQHIDPTERRSHNWYVVARLARGATLASARAEMWTIAGALATEYPQFMRGYGTNVVTMRDDLVADVRPLLLILMAGSVLLLLVACANVANLLLARAMVRRREMAVRAALGAGRGRLVRQLLTEHLVIAAVGGVLGTVAAVGFTRALVGLAPADIPRLSAVRMDGVVFAFGAGATIVSGILFGFAPMLRLVARGRRSDGLLHAVLRSGDRGSSGRQGVARSVLLVAELAISLVLLAAAGLLLRSASHLARIDYGFQPSGLTAAEFDLPRSRYANTARHIQFYDQLIDDVTRLPHVTGVAGTTESLGRASVMTFSFAIQGRPSRNPSGREDPQALRVVAGDYFRIMGIPVRRGRTFSPADNAGAPPVVIVNEALARLLWPGVDPVGARISFAGASGPWLDVVGVVGDTRSNTADTPGAPAMYLPFAQKRWEWMSWLTLVVRTDAASDPVALGAALRGVAARIDPRLPVQRVVSVAELYRESVARRRFATVLTGAFAVVALLLGLIGMYGVLSYSVSQRRREFSIRMALGARATQVTFVVVRQALILAAVAIVIGTGVGLSATRLLSDLLYETSPRDPATFVGVALLIAVVAAAAAWIPARRVTRIDPTTAMRDA
jgi:predicted permease